MSGTGLGKLTPLGLTLACMALVQGAVAGGPIPRHGSRWSHDVLFAARRTPCTAPQAMVQKTLTGSAAYTCLGKAVAIVGDLNGDGYDDLAVTAGDAGGSNEWKVYIFFGGPTMDTIPDLTLRSSVADEQFGVSLARAGDLNGDGYDDLVVGAYNGNSLANGTGKVYIYFGGAQMDSIPDVVLHAEAANDGFGWSVAGAGDVNGDGYPDVIVGAPYSNAGGSAAGRAYIYFGGAVVDSLPALTITGTLSTEDLGYSVAGAGDVNHDGYDDVIIGAYTHDFVLMNNAGRAYLYLGGSPMDNIPDVVYNGVAAFDYFGIEVKGVGDINGDGYDDILISARGVNSRGRASLFYGGSVLDNVVDVTLNGEGTSNFFGDFTAAGGDLNGDGHPDLIVGAPGYNGLTGRVYVYNGGAAMDTIADATFTGENTSDFFGCAVAGAGDLNGDGFPDLVVGAYRNNAGGTYAGRVYLYLSSAGPLPIQLASLTAAQTDGGRVLLEWSTISENNNYGFAVERKRGEDPDFASVPGSFTAGHGTTNQRQSYSWIDSAAPGGLLAYRLKQIDLDGTVHYSESASVNVHPDAEPAGFLLEQNYPNPFNPTTKIGYRLQGSGYGVVTLKVYDILGREVATLVNEVKHPGHYTVRFDAGGLASGMYLCTMRTEGFSATRELLLIH